MKFKVGDKVKFLNEPGEGVVSKIISSSMVMVAIEDGFDIPTMTSNLIKIEDSGYAGNMFLGGDKDSIVTTEEIRDQENEEVTAPTRLTRNIAGEKQAEGVYLAYVPHDQRWLVTGPVDIQIINNTAFDILYNIFFQEEDGHYAGFDYGSLAPESKSVLETIQRDEVEEWLRGHIQLMLHKDGAGPVYLPVHRDINLKPSRFLKEGSFMEADFMNEKAIIVAIALMGEMQKLTTDPVQKKFDIQEEKVKKAVPSKPKPLIDKHRSSEGEAIVDLHIGELTDNISGLSSHDMLNIQTDYFIRTLESAIAEKYRKVTFIHGVGNGTLKNAIMQKMKDYEGIEQYDASLARFGVGAVDIIIRYNQ